MTLPRDDGSGGFWSSASTPLPPPDRRLLRFSEITAHRTACKPFDRASLEGSLDQLRRLTVEPLSVSIPVMKDICARNGVAVVIIPEVKGARASGATKWLTPTKAMLVLSGRHKTDDQFWFTFFHEIGHVLKHGKKDTYVESEDPRDDPKEREADKFATCASVSARP